ncbi:MAG TPA: DUF3298/DUF4163 domain-containing protein [Clostridiales bacterium]|nr:DUF3298/DUF4163 domain-containing protein [Clostridiales bacterium]
MNRNFCRADINMEDFRRLFKFNNVEIMKLNIKYPILRLIYNPNTEWLVNSEIASSIDQYIKRVNELYDQAADQYRESLITDYPFHQYEAYMAFNAPYNQNCLLSVYNDEYEFTGGAHGNTTRSSATWELFRGTRLPLYSFFKPGTDYKKLLTDEIIKQAEKNLAENPGIYFDNYKDLIVSTFNPDSFYLTPHGLVIYYQQYDIAPYSTGIVEFTIPYDKIGWSPESWRQIM